MKFFALFIISAALAAEIDLKSYSEKVNQSLPEVYDHITKLRTTSVQNNNFYFHFLVKATQAEFFQFVPRVKTQVLKTICSQSRGGTILKHYKSNLIYQYENEKGQSLGEFMVQPNHCL